MKPIAVVGLVLIVVGLVALVYQGITYTSRETVIDIGPLHATADRQKTLKTLPSHDSRPPPAIAAAF